MKVIAIIFWSLLSVVARSQENPITEIEGRLNEMISSVSNMAASIQIKTTDYSSNLEDYHLAIADLNSRVENATFRFKDSILQIKSQIEEEIGKKQAELLALQSELNRMPTEGSKELVKKMKEDIKAKIAKLSKKIEKEYQEILRNLYTLDGFLKYPAKRVLHPFTIVPPLAIAGGISLAAIPLIVSGPLGLLGTAPFLMGGTYGVLELWDNWKAKTGRTIIKNNILETETRADRNFEGRETSAATKIFSCCKSSACTFLLAEDLYSWTESSRKLNMTLELYDGIKLRKIKTITDHLAKKRINEMAALYARARP